MAGKTDEGRVDSSPIDRVPTHHDDDRGRTQPALCPLVDLAEQRVLQASDRMLSPALAPCPAGQLGDPGPELVVPDDDEHPGLEVFGARGVGRGPEAAFHQRVVDRRVGEPAGRPLVQDHVEERVSVGRPGPTLLSTRCHLRFPHFGLPDPSSGPNLDDARA